MFRIFVWVALLAAVVYAVVWLVDRQSKGSRNRGGGSSPLARPAPKGPDDDDEFLRDLEWRRRREQRHRDTGTTGNDPDEGAP